jgi:hypothetical protein
MSSHYIYQANQQDRLATFKEKKLFFSYPKSFNDPYDCRLDLDGLQANNEEVHKSAQGHDIPRLKEYIRDYYAGGLRARFESAYVGVKLANEIVEWCDGDIDDAQLIKIIENHFLNNIGVRCFFSDKPNNVTMWAHYAGNHTGFCVGYEPTGHLPDPVTYKSYIDNHGLSELLLSSHHLIHRALTSKHAVWANEKETRSIELKPTPCEDKKGYGFLLSEDDANMKAVDVYLGYKVDDNSELKKDLIEECRKRGINLSKCVADHHDQSAFKLIRINITEAIHLSETNA